MPSQRPSRDGREDLGQCHRGDKLWRQGITAYWPPSSEASFYPHERAVVWELRGAGKQEPYFKNPWARCIYPRIPIMQPGVMYELAISALEEDVGGSGVGGNLSYMVNSGITCATWDSILKIKKILHSAKHTNSHSLAPSRKHTGTHPHMHTHAHTHMQSYSEKSKISTELTPSWWHWSLTSSTGLVRRWSRLCRNLLRWFSLVTQMCKSLWMCTCKDADSWGYSQQKLLINLFR